MGLRYFTSFLKFKLFRELVSELPDLFLWELLLSPIRSRMARCLGCSMGMECLASGCDGLWVML